MGVDQCRFEGRGGRGGRVSLGRRLTLVTRPFLGSPFLFLNFFGRRKISCESRRRRLLKFHEPLGSRSDPPSFGLRRRGWPREEVRGRISSLHPLRPSPGYLWKSDLPGGPHDRAGEGNLHSRSRDVPFPAVSSVGPLPENETRGEGESDETRESRISDVNFSIFEHLTYRTYFFFLVF